MSVCVVPTIATISPVQWYTSGSTLGGPLLTITGSYFGLPANGVVRVGPKFCNFTASNYTDTLIICNLPVDPVLCSCRFICLFG